MEKEPHEKDENVDAKYLTPEEIIEVKKEEAMRDQNAERTVNHDD